jgi:hypothetical protein
VPVLPDEAVFGLGVDDAALPALVPVVSESIPPVSLAVDGAPEILTPVPVEPEGTPYV